MIWLFLAFETWKFHIHVLTWLENLPKFWFGVLEDNVLLHTSMWRDFLSFAFINSDFSLYFPHWRGLCSNAQFLLFRKVISSKFLRRLLLLCSNVESSPILSRRWGRFHLCLRWFQSVRSGWILSAHLFAPRSLVPGSIGAGVITLLFLLSVAGSDDLWMMKLSFMSLLANRGNAPRWPENVIVELNIHRLKSIYLFVGLDFFLVYLLTWFKTVLKLKCMVEITLSSTEYLSPFEKAWWQSLRRCWEKKKGQLYIIGWRWSLMTEHLLQQTIK